MNSNDYYNLKFNIVLEDNKDFILASCPTLEIAQKYLEDMYERDIILAKNYGWQKIPKYKILINAKKVKSREI